MYSHVICEHEEAYGISSRHNVQGNGSKRERCPAETMPYLFKNATLMVNIKANT